MKKILLLSVIGSCLALNGCSKDINSDEVKESEQLTEASNLIEQDIGNSSYEFPDISNEDFYDDVIIVNNEELYRKLRFNDFKVGSKVIGAGLVHILQAQDDGRQTAIISTESNHNLNTGLYELLASKADFNGNLALLVFNPSEKVRVLSDDVIAFKGILAPNDTYTYTNNLGEIEEIPIIYVHYYKSGNLTIPLINKFLEKPKQEKIKNHTNTTNIEKPSKQNKSEIEKELEKTQQVIEDKSNVVKLADSSKIVWKHQPKIRLANDDLGGESRSLEVSVQVNEYGIITDAVITKSSGLPALDGKIIKATKFAEFEPYIESGVSHPFYVKIPFEFSPKSVSPE